MVPIPVLASPALEQRGAKDTRTIDGYRITMPVLHKVLPAMYAPGAQSCDKSPPRDPHSMGLAEMTRRLEGCAPVRQALTQAGLKPRETAIFYAALLRTSEVAAR